MSVSYYFEKRRALATGIAVCGSGIGAMAFGPIMQALLEVNTCDDDGVTAGRKLKAHS